MAVPAFRAATNNNSAATSSTLALTKPAGLAVGDLLIGFQNSTSLNNPLTSFPTTGWTSLGVVNAGSSAAASAEIVWKIATSADTALTTMTFGWGTAAAKVFVLAAFSGVGSVSTINKYASEPEATGTVFATQAVIPTVAETLIVAAWGNRAGTGTVTSTDATMPAAAQSTRTNNTCALGYVAGPGAGVSSGAKTATLPVSGAGFSFILAIAPPSTDVTPPAAPTGLTVVKS